MSESMARRVRNLQSEVESLEKELKARRERIRLLEEAVERLLFRMKRLPLPDGKDEWDEVQFAERVLRNG